ncbi:MAG: murein biosynthesis integral membrane protein MurJ [Gammaproteobacteria bacterium]|nr:murein biosynthesis integral membrane protein MurJ [Gammaproteobacteria bacterium]
MARNRLLRALFATGGMTLLSRLTGFVRDILLARLLGTSALADAFFVAFRIPNFLRRIFGEGAFSQAFVPVFAGYAHTDGPDRSAAQEFADSMAGSFALVLMAVSLIGVIAAPLLILILAPGFLHEPREYHAAVTLLRITFPYLFFISLVAMAGGMLNTRGRFAAAAFTPVLLNVTLIIAAGVIAPHTRSPAITVAWGVFAGGALQLLFQVPFLHRQRLLPRLRLSFRHPGVRRVFQLMIPGLFGASIAQINLIVDTMLASFLATGSIAWLYYANRLLEFPLGVFGIALGTVILPHLSAKHAQASAQEFAHTLDWALKWVAVIAVPAAMALIVLSGPLVVTLFNYGHFSRFDAVMTEHALMAFAIGLPAFVLIKVLAPGYYARQDTKTPVKIGVVALIANIVFNGILIWPLAHVGLALATSLSGILNAALLYRGLRRGGVYEPSAELGGLVRRALAGSVAMGLVLLRPALEFSGFVHASAAMRFLWLGGWIAAGLGVYVTVIWIIGVRPRLLRLA